MRHFLKRTDSFSNGVSALALAAVSFGSLVAPAAAQILPEGVSWANIPRPEYDALGVPLGSFDLFPTVDGIASYNSNVFAAPTDREDDFVLTVRPALDLRSNWSRHRLDVSAQVESAFYTSLSDENHTDFALESRGELDVTDRTVVFFNGGFRRRHETRISIDTVRNSLNPIELNSLTANIGGIHQFNKLSIEIGGSVSNRDFEDGVTTAGMAVDQDFRDETRLGAEFTMSYEFSPGYSVFASARYSDNDFDLGPGDPGFQVGTDIDRDFATLTLDAGITAEVTDVLYATIGVGRLRSTFGSNAFDSFSAVSARANVLWNLTSLSSVIVDVERSAQTSILNVTPARLDTGVEVGVDHELLYNLILVGRAGYKTLNFQGIDRTDKEYNGSLRARYLLNNQWRAEIGYAFAQRDSILGLLNFNRHTISAGITFAF